MKKGTRVFFTALTGLLPMGCGGYMLYLFFTIGWLPPALAWVLRGAAGVFILTVFVLTVRQLKKTGKR